MSTLHERSGVRVLPVDTDELATVVPWTARLCVSADHRKKYPEYAKLAGELVVMT